MDNGLETFMQEEGQNQIMNLILEEHADNVMFGDISEFEDYEDWIRYIVEDEERRNEQFLNATSIQVSNVFQLDASSKIMGEEAQFQTSKHDDNKWVKIKSKIKVDFDLKQEKTKQLWSLLDQFLNIFAWHKRELGCCKHGEHIVDTHGFPPCRPLPTKFHYRKRPSKEIDRCASSFGQNEDQHIELCLQNHFVDEKRWQPLILW